MKRAICLSYVMTVLAAAIMPQFGCFPQPGSRTSGRAQPSAARTVPRTLPPHLAPRPMPTGPDANFERAKEAMAKLEADTEAPRVWDSAKEARFAQLVLQAQSLGVHAAEAEQLRADFARLLLAYRFRKLKQELLTRLPESYADSVGIQMKLIALGTFMMGSPASESGRSADEGPQRLVTITRPYYIAVHEVTQAQWKAVMGTEPWRGEVYARQSPDLAASYVSWEDAAAFCRKLSAVTGTTVRLPTEAEWEYACRAGTTTAYSFGDDSSKLGDYAWYNGNADSKGEDYAHPVGRKKPNAWGLHDMHGNVWEWCDDWYADSYANADARDPKGPVTGTARVLRGGSWVGIPQYCRAAYRYGSSPGNRYVNFGFRVVVVSGVGVD